MHRNSVFLFLLSAAVWAGHVPTIDELLNVKVASASEISPDGKWVAYTVTEADFKKDAFVTHVWLASANTHRNFPLTAGVKSDSNPKWSPDGKWLAFTSARSGDTEQIFLIRPDGGEAVQLTKTESSVSNFVWSPDGKSIAFTADESNGKASKDRKELLGEFTVVRKDYSYKHIWTVDVEDALKEPATGKQLTKGKQYSVSALAWSPDGTRIAFSAQRNPDLIQGVTADIYVLTPGTAEVKKIVASPGPDNSPVWSPDSRRIAFVSAMGNPKYMHGNRRIAVVDADGGTPRSVSDLFDESPALVDWKEKGIYFSALQKTSSHLFAFSRNPAQSSGSQAPTL